VNSSPRDCRQFRALKQNIYGHEFKEDGELVNSFDMMAANTG